MTEKSMLTISKQLTLLSALVIAIITCPAPVNAQEDGQKIGVVQMQTVLSKHPKLKQLETNLKAEEERLHKMIERSNKDYQDAKKQKKPEAELKTLRTNLQGQIDKEVNTYQKKLMAKEKNLQDELYSAIEAEAKSKNLTTVMKKSAILVGGVDITDGVVQRIAKSSTSKKSATK